MAFWGVVAGIYGLTLTAAALTLPIGRRPIVVVACLSYALVAVGAGTMTSSFWVQLIVPGALLLVGYWLSGFFFRDPQPWLERFLLRSDQAVFRGLGHRLLCFAEHHTGRSSYSRRVMPLTTSSWAVGPSSPP